MQTDLSTYNNSWYKPAGSVKRIAWFYINVIFFKTSMFPFYGFKRGLLRLFGAKIGVGVLIKPNVNIKYPWLLHIGNHVWVGEEVWLDNLAQVTIGNNVCISQGALLLCGNHNYSVSSFDLSVKPIVLNDGVWIGAKAIVSGGTTCQSHAVLTAGSVCSGTLEAFSIYRGNPALKIKDRMVV